MNRQAGQILELCRAVDTIEGLTTEIAKKHPSIPLERIRCDTQKTIEWFLRLKILLPFDEEIDAALPHFIPSYMEYVSSSFRNELRSPVRVALELTSACNASCPHCYASASNAVPNELSTEEWKKIINELSQQGVLGISFTGGEPLLRTDIEELVTFSTAKGLRCSMATNGFLLTEERINALCFAGVKAFMISLDGAKAETHERFRGLKGLFDQVIKSIKILLDKRVEVGVLTTITKLNLDEITEIMTLVASLHVRRHALMRFVRSGRGSQNFALEPTLEDYTVLLPKIWKKSQEIKTSILYPDLPAACFEKTIGLDHYKELKRVGKVGSCGAGISTCAVSPSGNLKPCDVSGQISVGNLKYQPIEELWKNSRVFKELRCKTKSDVVPCKECRLNGICIAGCKALPCQLEDVNRISPDPICVECYTLLEKEQQSNDVQIKP